jgi:hypothetical protein
MQMNGLSLDQVLAELTTKTAAADEPKVEVAKETTKVAAARNDLLAALKRAEGSTKEASAPVASAPVAELTKVASDLAAADQEALVKEAQFYGAAICDGFMSRLGQFETAAGSLPGGEKVASAQDVEKIAEEAVRGYVETQNFIKQAAEQEFQRGYQETVAQIEKVAADTFTQGAQHCAELLNQLRS